MEENESEINKLLNTNIKENEEEKDDTLNDLLPKILEKSIQILNDIGNKIQFLKKTLAKPDIAFTNDKKMIIELLNKEKEIFCNISLLNKIFPKSFKIPDKLYNTRAFLEICFVDLINSKASIFDMDIAGQIILIQYQRYENQSIEFLLSKKKYIIPLLKLSITMLDNNNLDIDNEKNENNEKKENDGSNEKGENKKEIFDLKKYLKDILKFVDNMINNDKLFDDNFKLSVMPGLVSKLIKLMQSNIKITTKMLINICSIIKKYMIILFKDNNPENNNTNQFFQFYEVFIFTLFDKYQIKLKGIIENIIQMNILYLNKINTKILSKNFYANIFYLINSAIFDLINNIEYKNVYNSINNINTFDDFYIAYIKVHDLFSINEVLTKIEYLIKQIEGSYIKKEFLKFNKRLIDLLGLFTLVIYYNKFNEAKNTINDLLTKLSNLFCNIIRLNDNKIFFEVINSYEFLFLNINKEICKSNIINEYFKTIINTYNNEYKLHVLFLYINHLYEINPEIYNFLFDYTLNLIISKTKQFNNKLLKKKFSTFSQLNDNINEIINTFVLIEFFILFSKGNNNNLLNNKNINKINSIIHFYYDLFIDSDNEESFSKAKINNTKLSLINIFLLNLSIFLIERYEKYIIEEKNILILLSMFNYSNNAIIMKYSASLLILNINQNKDLKFFIKTNYTFLINSILNKIIYFNETKETNLISANKCKNNFQHLKSVILCVFSSLIELINNLYYDDEINRIFVVEFYNYIEKLFPYFDNNIKEKNEYSIDIMLEIFIKISSFQKNVLISECKKNNLNISQVNVDMLRSFSEEFDNDTKTKNKELFTAFKTIKKILKLEKCNICRKLILRFIPLILSKKITFFSKCLQIIQNYLLLLFLLPMEKEEDENFSEEDPDNVVISSSLGPIMYELWKPLVYAFYDKKTTLAGFNIFLEVINKIAEYHPDFFDGEKVFEDLLPCVSEKIMYFEKEYKVMQFYECVNNFAFIFLKKIFASNKYNVKYKADLEKFFNDYKKYMIVGCDEPKIRKINMEINRMMYSFSLK